ncbi:HAD-IA family hydrolase [Spirillospora sp. NPDC047279]|uniref:HAD family hydrolase n=1 Tax=Spirillospora sp. NPDC047279 TaxID=3155478 RepID=UPI0033BFBE19
MRYKAVIFDYFGTLTVASAPEERVAAVSTVAETIGAPVEEFRTLWWQTWPERCVGDLGDFSTALAEIASRMGLSPSAEQLAEATERRRTRERAFRTFRHDAVSTLRRLREWDLGVALVSDCTDELPDEWDGEAVAPYIQVPVFSYTARMRKPDPRIYALAYEGLGVRPADCLYVGDGGSNELKGAEAVGMTAVRVLDDGVEHHRFEPVDWPGPEITSLSAVLDLVSTP